MHPFTLGYETNPLISTYQKSFVRKLRQLWTTLLDIPLPDDMFLLYPDVHSLLLASSRPDESRKNIFKDQILIQYDHYVRTHSFPSKEAHTIQGTSILLTDEYYNPDIATDSHPDHIRDRIGVSFGTRSPEDWNILFARTFSILEGVAPGFFSEINFLLRKILPFGQSQGTHNSGSYSDAIGHITMSYPEDVTSPEIVILEALIHEYNHNKVNLILHSEMLLGNDYSEKYYSPYRTDPRTIHGIYLGLHALSGAYWVIWKAYSESRIQMTEIDIKKGIIYVLKNSASIQMLQKHALFTPLGRQFFSEMISVHKETLAFMRQSSISDDLLQGAKEIMKEHYKEACMQHPSILG